MVLSAKMQDLEDEAIERGLEQGLEQGELGIVDATLMLREGKSEQDLLALGFKQTTIERAKLLK